jgi:hypothetical protein
MRRITWAAAALSVSLVLLCLGAALCGGSFGPLVGSVAAAVAAVALVRCARASRAGQIPIQIDSEGGVRLDSADCGGAQAVFWPVAVTGSLICLARADRGCDRRSIWRDAIAPDGFRRIAAYGLWRRSVLSNPTDTSELIARYAVRCRRTVPRPGWPRAE